MPCARCCECGIITWCNWIIGICVTGGATSLLSITADLLINDASLQLTGLLLGPVQIVFIVLVPLFLSR